MSVEVPAIYSPRTDPAVMTPWGRGLAFLTGLVCLAILTTAARVTPSPTGMGTHLQLGLQKCGWYNTFGLPCPSCGMTTSFAWFARGNLLASFYIQPMGALLALLAVITFWTGAYIAFTGR